MSARKGRRNEHRSREILEAAGYEVTRAAASKGVWDLIGLGEHDIVLVQVKTNAWPSALEWEAMKLSKAPPNARKIVHRWRDRVAVPDVKDVA
jgi:Holliday junction resolvase